jgi:hypothetical protein
MTYELLVEIPEAVVKVFHLGTSATNLGLRSPTVFALDGAIALVNVSLKIVNLYLLCNIVVYSCLQYRERLEPFTESMSCPATRRKSTTAFMSRGADALC